MKFHIKKAIPALAALTTFATATAAPLSINLTLTDGAEQYFYHNPLMVGSAALNVKDVSFYVSNVALVKADGTEVPVEGLSLAQLQKGTPPRNIEIFAGEAPEGDYRGIRFDVGVPRELNHMDATNATGPLSIENGMYWAWNSGYIFFSLHGDVGGTKIANHMGGDSHKVTVNLADLQKPGTGFSVGAEGVSIPVNLDLQKLYAQGAGGESWDFSKPQYQQVHFGAVADQFYANVAGAFSRGDMGAAASAVKTLPTHHGDMEIGDVPTKGQPAEDGTGHGHNHMHHMK